MVTTNLKGKKLKREWLRWIERNLGNTSDLPEKTKLYLLAALRGLKAEQGAARSFEHESVPFAVFSATLWSSLNRLGIRSLVAVIGDADEPVVVRVDVNDLETLLREIARRDSTVVLAAETADGIVVADPPTTEADAGEILISATGTLASVIDDFAVQLPGGVEFRGN